jgi:hypothetical protein
MLSSGSPENMSQYLALIFLVLLAATSVAGEDAVFHKSRIFDRRGKERRVDLVFSGQNSALVVREKTTVVVKIPFGTIEKVTYTPLHTCEGRWTGHAERRRSTAPWRYHCPGGPSARLRRHGQQA